MPVELDAPAPASAGFLSTAEQPGTSAAAQLAKSLGLLGELAVDGLNVAQRREVEEIEDLLKSPALTPEEAHELGESASFPLARDRALNREGELLAQQAYDTLLDAVADAPDAPAAREQLRQIQADVLSRSTDAAVQAGVRERFAAFAPNLLAQASARRVKQRNQREVIAMSQDLSASFDASGTLGFGETLRGMVTDEVLTGGDPNRVHVIALTTLENKWLEGQDPSDPNPNSNLNAREVLTSIDALLGDPLTSEASTRSKYLKLRQDIVVGQERARNSLGNLNLLQNKQTHTALTRLADEYVRNGTPVPDSLAEALRNTAGTAGEVRAASEFANNLERTGMAGTAEASNARKQLNIAMGENLLTGQFNAPHAPEAIAYFEQAIRTLPPVQEPVERQRILNELVREANTVGREQVSRREADRKEFEQEFATEFGLLESRQGSDEDIAALDDMLDERWLTFQRQRFSDRLNEWARDTGVNLNNIVRTR